MKKRIVLFFIFLGISVLSIIFVFIQALRIEKGYRVIPVSSLEIPVDIYLNYNIGYASSRDLKQEFNDVSDIYTKAYTYSYFQLDSTVKDDVRNVHYINQHYNEVIRIDPFLYDALKACSSEKSSILYYGPILAYYDDFLSIDSIDILHKQDPFKNRIVQSYFLKIIEFIHQQAIQLNFYEDYTVMLEIDDDYLRFCTENEIKRYIDFGVLKNAIITEYISNCLKDSGHIYGYLQSTDGIFQGLCPTMSYTIDLYDEYRDVPQRIGKIGVEGCISFVQFHSFAPASIKIDSEYRNYYIDKMTGLSKNIFHSIAVYSNELSLLDVFLQAYPMVTGEDGISLKDTIECLWMENEVVRYTDINLEIISLLDVYQRKNENEIF